jgi:histone H2A
MSIDSVQTNARGGATATVVFKRKKKPVSRSSRAGISFPVGRIHRELRQGRYALRCATGAPVYAAAVLEYLTAEVLELAGNCAKDRKHKRILPRDLLLAIHGDEELATLTKNATISQGGVLPHIHVSLLSPAALKKREAVFLATDRTPNPPHNPADPMFQSPYLNK